METLSNLELETASLPSFLDKSLGAWYFGSTQLLKGHEERLVFFPHPFDPSQGFFEFEKKDVLLVENIETVSDPYGHNAMIKALCVRRGSLAFTVKPFNV